jgi:outer membrane protein assembly factor BamB
MPAIICVPDPSKSIATTADSPFSEKHTMSPIFPDFTCILMLALFFSVSASAIADDEWPQFRGPNGQGVTSLTGLPLTWSETDNVVWKATIPGEGHSSPVISGDQIWLTTAIAEPLSEAEMQQRLAAVKNSQGLSLAGTLSLQALCLSRDTGRILHQVTLFTIETPEPKHALNSYASPTPVICRDRVFFHFGTYGTAAVNRETGAMLWKNDRLKLDHQNGPGSSPVVWEDLMIVHLDGTDSQSIAALKQETGEIAWQTKRSGEMDPTPELQKAYGTPLLVELQDRPLVISPAANWVYAYDARDGKEVWKASYGKLGFSTVPRPVVVGDTVYVATSYMQSRLLAVNMTGIGDVTSSHIRWMSDKQIPQKPSLVAWDGKLYFVSDKGIVRCLNAETGDEVWFERLPGDYSASPLAAEGRLYFCNQDGVCTVLRAGDQFEVLATNKLDSAIMASPAAAGQSLFLRTATALYRVEQK